MRGGSDVGGSRLSLVVGSDGGSLHLWLAVSPVSLLSVYFRGRRRPDRWEQRAREEGALSHQTLPR